MSAARALLHLGPACATREPGTIAALLGGHVLGARLPATGTELAEVLGQDLAGGELLTRLTGDVALTLPLEYLAAHAAATKTKENPA
jgi:hypothetical protein